MNAPYAPQEVSEVSQLVKSLEACTKKGGGGKRTARSKKNTYDAGNNVSVDSWQFQEWDYKRRDLPIYARGLFTYHRRDHTPEIAVRGYDKFFNVGEVHETQWENVKTRTRGPYELSVKENGCIIFLAGLEDDHLLVCSKHSTGARQDADLSHAIAGEKWVDRHLSTVGKTRADLARELRRRNVTAVAELCDDQFEEHVLAYEPKDAGLYLHGMNLNLPEFATYPGELVHKFADEWGFRKAQYLIKDDVASMQEFLSQCAETGSYAGRDTEGFVIRCEHKDHGTTGGYHNWFFKYKFEEPYLMYRQWRECTKQVINGKPPKYKKHKKITEEYLLYARRQLAKDPSIGKDYNHNHGIIAMRDGFLKERGLKGSDIIQQELEDEGSSDNVMNNVILLPVASIGCGKTTVALALMKLFNWGHVQNDNITGKQNRPKQFTTQICNSLGAYPVCIADRNNHQKRERKQITADVLNIIPQAKFIALQYVHNPKPEMLPSIRKITQERIFARGDNHQTIQAGSKSRQEIINIMEGFLDRFEPVNPQSAPDDVFDNIINLDVASSSRANLETVVSSLHNKYPLLVKKMPSPSDFDNAIGAALNDYEPHIKHDLSFRSNKVLNKQANSSSAKQTPQNGSANPPKPPKLEYFCIKLPTSAILSTLATLFSTVPPEGAKMYRQLQTSRRIQPSFHLTLMHGASIPSHPELWQHLSSLHANAVTQAAQTPNPTFDPVLGKCRIRLERVVWDDRVMCVVARLLDEGWESVNEVAHVTIGTARDGIKPKESNDLLKKWLSEEGGAQEKEVEGFVEVTGEVKAVMQATR
ncbi:MAG: hypothetical protein Q9217_004390 [Psora testacea]